MGEIRRDLVRDSWVVIATDRAVKPRDLPVPKQGHTAAVSGFCPFCPGNENVTPPELDAIRPEGSPPNGPGWDIRAIPNKFTAFSPDVPWEEKRQGLYQLRSGFGSHEVVIESPEHDVQFHQHDEDRIIKVLNMLKSRYEALASNPLIQHIQIYKNQGLFAGASLKHSHMQIIAYPYITDQWKGALSYAEENGSCLFCDLLAAETATKERLVAEEDDFVIICPYASRFSFETWVIPKKHAADFTGLTARATKELAYILKKLTGIIVKELDDPSYNMIINNAPANTSPHPGYHWYVEVYPRLIVQAGVELATGFYMNPISPEWAAETLRQQW